MYCANCGKELRKTDKFCSNCGKDNPFYEEEIIEPEFEQVEEPKITKKDDKHEEVLSTLGIVLLFFIFPVGFILSIIGWCTFKNPSSKNTAMAGTIIGIVLLALSALAITLAVFSLREYFQSIEREIALFL